VTKVVVTGNPLLGLRADRPHISTSGQSQVSVQHAVAAAIVHQNNFTGIRRGIDEAGHLGGKQRKAVLLVVAGNDDA